MVQRKRKAGKATTDRRELKFLAESFKRQSAQIDPDASAAKVAQLVATYDRLVELGATFEPDIPPLMEQMRETIATSFIMEVIPPDKRKKFERFCDGVAAAKGGPRP